MKKSTIVFIGVVVILALVAFYFAVYKKSEKFSFDDFWSDVGNGFETAGDDVGATFKKSASIVGGALQKAENWVGVEGQNVSNNLATFGPTQIYQGGRAGVNLLTEIAYDSELVIEEVGSDDLSTGFGLISTSLAPYITQPSTNKSPTDGIPGWEEYIQTCSLDIIST